MIRTRASRAAEREHRMHRRPPPRRWVVAAIARTVRYRGHPPSDDRSSGCDGVWARPRKKHLHDRACAAECHGLVSSHSNCAGRMSTRVPWWPCNWPCGCVVVKGPVVMRMRWRTVRRSRRSEVKWVATGCSRRRTTPVVDWRNGTLSDDHSRGGLKSGDDEAEDQARFTQSRQTGGSSQTRRNKQRAGYSIQDITQAKQKGDAD